MMTSLARRILVVLLAIGPTPLAFSPAHAQIPEPFPTYRRGDGYTYRQDYKSKRPLKGHEGFYGIGPNLRYCSYIRIPNRECGKNGCRVTSWTTQQYCY